MSKPLEYRTDPIRKSIVQIYHCGGDLHSSQTPVIAATDTNPSVGENGIDL